MRIPKYIYFNPFFRLRGSKSADNHIFVVGAPRSGTTLLANVISNHSNICSYSGETGLFLWRSCFALFEGAAERNAYELNRLRKDCRDVVQYFDRLAQECKIKNQCERFLEKTAQHVLQIGFIVKHFPNAKLVHIVRDPRDCYVSSKSNRYVVQDSPRKYARYWRCCIEARNRFAHHSRIFDVKYEHLVTSPYDVLEELMDWVGENFEASQLDPTLMMKDPRAGTPEFRLLGQAVSGSSVERWKKELSLDEIRTIESTVGHLLHNTPRRLLSEP